MVRGWERIRTAFFSGARVVYPLQELQEAGRTPGGRRADERRTTIQVFTLELQRTVDALPVLLPLLGIPVDAVGVVVQSDERPEGRYVVPATNTETSQGTPARLPAATSSWKPGQCRQRHY